MYEEMAMKKLEQLKVFDTVMEKVSEDGIEIEKPTQVLNKEATKEKWEGHLKVMTEALEEEEINHKIALCRQAEFLKNPTVLDHQATFAFELESDEWKKLQTQKLQRSFQRDVNGAELTVDRIKVLIDVLQREIEAM